MIHQNKNKMTTQEVLSARNEKGIISLSNENAQWSAISRANTHIITFYGGEEIEYKFYKNEKSFAIRVSQLLKRGY